MLDYFHKKQKIAVIATKIFFNKNLKRYLFMQFMFWLAIAHAFFIFMQIKSSAHHSFNEQNFSQIKLILNQSYSPEIIDALRDYRLVSSVKLVSGDVVARKLSQQYGEDADLFTSSSFLDYLEVDLVADFGFADLLKFRNFLAIFDDFNTLEEIDYLISSYNKLFILDGFLYVIAALFLSFSGFYVYLQTAALKSKFGAFITSLDLSWLAFYVPPLSIYCIAVGIIFAFCYFNVNYYLTEFVDFLLRKFKIMAFIDISHLFL